MTADLLPGMYFLHHSSGWVGRSISGAQGFVRGGSYWTHAGLYLGDGQIIEAEPGGARICDFDSHYQHATILWSDAPIQRHLEGMRAAGLPVDDVVEAAIRRRVAREARALEGTKYSYLDYLSIAAVEWKWPGWERLKSYVENTGHMICSALCDRAYLNAGVHLFDDGRTVGDVTPGDLDRYDQHWVRQRLAHTETRLRRIETRLGLDQWAA